MAEPSLLLELLQDWVRERRWFPVKGEAVTLRLLGTVELPVPAPPSAPVEDVGDVEDMAMPTSPTPVQDQVLVLVLAVDAASGSQVIQVPVVLTSDGAQAPGLIAPVGDRYLVDGPAHPSFVRAWLRVATASAGAPMPAELGLDTSGARMFEGEQSNTSVLIPGPTPAILKVFRTLSAGSNPEVEVAGALTAAGWPHVPALLGWLHASWPAATGGGSAVGDLGVLSELVADAVDGFDLASARARAGASFAAEAGELGTVLGELHEELAEAFGTAPQEPGRPAALAEHLRERAAWAASVVPQVAQLHERADAILDDVATLDALPADQRVHGDLHLGQVLRGAPASAGWYVLDFEGEPLRPMAQRNLPDQPLRDVAGVLRSIDYAAAVGGAADPQAWAADARSGFLRGYLDRAPALDPETTSRLVRALELDKALYEAVYEFQNRPDWLPIPLAGIRRLIEENEMTSDQTPSAEPSVDPTAEPAVEGFLSVAGPLPVTTPSLASGAPLPVTPRIAAAIAALDTAPPAEVEVPEQVEATSPAEPASTAPAAPTPAGQVPAGQVPAPATPVEAAAAPLVAPPAQLEEPEAAEPETVEPETVEAAKPEAVAPEAIAPQPDAAAAAVPDESEPDAAPAGPTPAAATDQLLDAVAQGRHFAPHDVLGAHLRDGVVTIRTLRHLARGVTVVTERDRHEMTHERGGVWVAAFAADQVPDYRLEVDYDGAGQLVDDPYRFLPTLGEVDQHLIREGRHERLWEVLGAHVRRYPSALGEVHGTSFAVWAPNARAVRVVGDFNGWDGTSSAMRTLGDTGIWEVFLPGVGDGNAYKFEIQYPDGSWHAKADPMARRTEVPPATASIVTESGYEWGDGEWMAARATKDPHNGPMNVYEVHLGSWRQGLNYRELAEQLVEYVSWMGFSHVEFMPVAEHPFGGSWGYQVTGYYAPTSRFGTPDEFRHLVDKLHEAGIGVIVDWVPAHFPKDSWALARFDGTPLYEDPDPLRGEHQDWGTLIFNFGRAEVRNFLVANAVYWLDEFHIDGLRVDAVASMLYLDYSRKAGQWRPNVRGGRENLEAIQFLQETNATAYRTNPGIVMIAEESTAFPGVTAPTSVSGLGFGLKWNMGWMNDTLRYLAEEPINRRYHHGELTFSLVYAFSEQFVLPLSHDEVVHGKGSLVRKMPGDRWQQLANVRALFAYQWTHPGKNLLFMGGEFAQDEEWSEAQSLNWGLSDTPAHAAVRLLVRDLNLFSAAHPALWADDFSGSGFEWLEAGDGDHNLIAYLRKGTGPDGTPSQVAVLVNFAGTPHEGYRVPLPHGGRWVEALNTDAETYGGSGVTNPEPLQAQDRPWGGRAHSVALRVPPLGAVILVPERD